MSPALQADYPGTTQVSLVGLERASDAQLCDYAQANGFLICSKDDDFAGLVAARGTDHNSCASRWEMSARTQFLRHSS
ncbi:MAG: DUF5615 family PIN-like protein [Xanthomonadales bacterium]|nr:DUF5615 family PIN-like protein [Xanthomonadales bacterium]